MSDITCNYCGEIIKDKESCKTLACEGRNINFTIQRPDPSGYKHEDKDD